MIWNAIAVIALSIGLLANLWGDITARARLTAIESKATAPVENPPYVGEFAAERIAGRVRQHCEWKERTERLAVLTCSYTKEPNGKRK